MSQVLKYSLSTALGTALSKFFYVSFLFANENGMHRQLWPQHKLKTPTHSVHDDASATIVSKRRNAAYDDQTSFAAMQRSHPDSADNVVHERISSAVPHSV